MSLDGARDKAENAIDRLDDVRVALARELASSSRRFGGKDAQSAYLEARQEEVCRELRAWRRFLEARDKAENAIDRLDDVRVELERELKSRRRRFGGEDAQSAYLEARQEEVCRELSAWRRFLECLGLGAGRHK